MKSVLSTDCCDKKPELPFPKLMVSSLSNRVVLFSSSGDGIVVGVTGNFNLLSRFGVGYDSANWSMDSFTDYKGDVCLSNS